VNKFTFIKNLDQLKKDSCVYIYGSGTFGMSLFYSLQAYRPDIKISGFLDSFKKGEKFNRPIVRVADFGNLKEEYDCIIIAAAYSYWQIMADLLTENGIDKHYVNIFWDFNLYGEKHPDNYENHKHLVPVVKGLFSDEQDISVWDTITTSMRYQNIEPSLEYWVKADKTGEINYGKYIHLEKGDVVINGGSSFGSETNGFMQMVGKEGKIFAFDPNMGNDWKLEDESVINVPMVLYDRTMEVPFSLDGSRSMIISDDSDGSMIVHSTSIDDFVRSQHLDRLNLIKLDIEGAELHALKGGMDSIKKFRPSLAISIYHTYEHFFEIPLFIAGALLDYKFHIDYYDPFCIDTIFYAIPAEIQ
jgi:FkbM family methyltransferase